MKRGVEKELKGWRKREKAGKSGGGEKNISRADWEGRGGN